MTKNNKYITKLAKAASLEPESVIYTTFKGEHEPDMLMHEHGNVYTSNRTANQLKSQKALSVIRRKHKLTPPISDAIPVTPRSAKPSILSVIKEKLGVSGKNTIKGIGKTLARF